MKKHIPIEPILRENILLLATAYANSRGIKMTTLSGECHGDPPFLDRLWRKEGSFTIRKYDEIMSWFLRKWPKGVKRPSIRTVRGLGSRRGGA